MTAPAQRTDELPGRVLGDFVVRERIGEGGFGAVYRAEQPLLGRAAVIKVLHTRHRSNEEVIQRFLREARLASRLDHPYAAHIYAFGAEQDGLLWIAMELVRGTPLDKLLKQQGPLALERFVPLLDRIAEVVHTAHEQGIIHRDLKPANVMVLSRAGRLLPKLLDFGIAKALGDLEAPTQLADVGEPEPVEPEPAAEPSPAAALEDTMVHSTPTPAPAPRRAAAAVTAPSVPSPGASVDVAMTKQGVTIGSPPYMAPEQWVDPRAVSARSDLYALAALSYEALFARPLFAGATLQAVARAHARRERVPELPPAYPLELRAVLEKALARNADDRFANALEYAAAFRGASGLASEPTSLPQLDDTTRDAALTAMPQPIAEAVAALEGARNVHQAQGAQAQVVHVALRYVGLVAIACRTQVRAPGEDTAPVIDLLRRLRRHGLDDDEWVTLARELTRPFARRRDAYPVPELVSLFFAADGEPLPTSPFDPVLMTLAGSSSGTGAAEEWVLQQLHRTLPELARLLGALSFLTHYPLAVGRGENAERWMGARLLRRTLLPLRGRALTPGAPALLDADGHPLVLLAPLLQVAAPTPGAPEELFLLEGHGRAGARLVALPSGFERQDEQVWEWFRQHLLDVEDERVTATAEQSPFRGLSAFTAADAGLFFGREREAEALANRLRVQPLLAVVGPSGAGKSSFVQAGVVPSLPSDWRALTVRPGPSPMAALAARLAREEIVLDDPADPAALGRALRAAADARGETLLLIIDQFEELFTLAPDGDERRAYAEALVQAARSAEDPVRVVFTLRDDFLMRAQQLPSLRERLGQGLQLVATPAPEDLIRILVEPARRAGYSFADPQLPEEMVRAVADQPGALPLLSFTAAKLWELRDRHFKQLPRRAYESMGGVGGALAQHAEEMLAQLTADEQRLVREAFRQLVTSQGTRAVLSRTELRQLLGGGEQVDALTEKLIAARLLVASEGEGGEVRVEVVHEALLSAWPRLVTWRREDAEGARLRDQVRTAARQWAERARPRGLLWRGDALGEYKLWRRRHPGALTEVEEAFGQASLADAARGLRIRTAIVAGAFLLLSGSLIGALYAERKVSISADAAKEALAFSNEEQGRRYMLDGEPLQALVYLNEAFQAGRDNAALRYLIGSATRALQPELAVLRGHTDRVWTGTFSHDAARIVTASQDHTGKIWDATSGKLILTLTGHTKTVYSAEFDPTDTQVVTAGWDDRAIVWDARTGRQVFALPHSDLLFAARFSPDGTRILTASRDKTARLWNREGKLLATLSGHSLAVGDAQFSLDGKRLLTAGYDGNVRLWDASGRLTAVLKCLQAGRVHAASFSPDGQRVVSGDDESAKLWDAASSRQLATLQGHTGEVQAVAFSPDGALIATASQDRTAKLWPLERNVPLATLEGHGGVLYSVAFSADGLLLATASADGTVRTWDATTGSPVMTYAGHGDAINQVSFDGRSDRLLTASSDGTARLWNARHAPFVSFVQGSDVVATRLEHATDRLIALTTKALITWDITAHRRIKTMPIAAGDNNPMLSHDGRQFATLDGRIARVWSTDGELKATLTGHTDVIYRAAFSRDGTRIITSSRDETAKVWRIADGALLHSLTGHSGRVRDAVFSPDGHRMATASADKTARIWDEAGVLLGTLRNIPRRYRAWPLAKTVPASSPPARTERRSSGTHTPARTSSHSGKRGCSTQSQLQP